MTHAPGADAPADIDGLFAVECPACHAHAAVGRDLVGRAAVCPGCRSAYRVPAPRHLVAPSPRPPAPATTGGSPGADAPLEWNEPPLPRSRRQPEQPAAVTQSATSTAPAAPDAEPAVSAAGAAGGDFSFREPVKTIRSGHVEIELHRLTEEERRTRRARRNLLILVVGAALLVALVVILGKGGR